MSKTTKQTSGRGSTTRGRRGTGSGSQSGGAIFTWFTRGVGRLFSLLRVNYQNRRIATVVGLALSAFLIIALFSVLTFLFSDGQDQSLIAPIAEGEALPEEEQSAFNIFGRPGARIADYLFNRLFGWGIIFLFAYALYLAYHLVKAPEAHPIRYVSRFLFFGFLCLWTATAAATLQAFFPSDSFLLWGGEQGLQLYTYIYSNIRMAGLLVVLLFSLLIFSVLCSDRALIGVRTSSVPLPHLRATGLWGRIMQLFSRGRSSQPEDSPEPPLTDDEGEEAGERESDEDEEEYEPTPQPLEPDPEHGVEESPMSSPHHIPSSQASIHLPSDKEGEPGMVVELAPADQLVEDRPEPITPLAPGVLLAHYQKPTTDLLRDYEQGATQIDMQEIERNKQKIIDTLASFKMRVTPSKATVGPTVTLYEVIPDSGIKVSRIKTMEDDIAMSLKSEGVRIIAPMPGQGTIGIEVPNSSPQTVSMRSILASKKYREQLERMELPIGIGKTITNEPFVFDLAKMPHLLIAGATGQGKSVGLNALITSLLYSKRPEELKFVMVDPKMLEFSIYEEIEKHFLAKLPDADKAIITDMKRVVATLNSLCVEMDNRYHLLQNAGRAVRNIKEYNEQVRSGELRRIDGHELLPYIVLIVDEFADLMMTVGKEVEQPIARLAQKARAAGIHMVIATQRPSTDVITGLSKANFPARIAFKVFSMVDSRTVLDSPGANQLIGRGDMLFYQGKEMVRVQCAFMDSPETEAIVSHIAHQESTGSALILPEYIPEGEDGGAKTFNPNEKDSLFDEVARMVVQTQVGSTSNIQRKFNIGYNRAGRLMDQLEGAGIVGPQDGSKPREVFIKDQASLEELLERL